SRSPDEEALPRYHVAPRGLLNFYALLSIGRKPMSGYDLMREIEDKTQGAWHPGPGAVYPVLQKLAREGYVVSRKKSGEGPAEILYEITPAGLSNIANAKKAMGSSGVRMRMMSSLFLDLMEPEDLVRFALNSFELQKELVRTIVESDKSELSEDDKLYVIRQYRLSLERELARADETIKRISAGSGLGQRPAGRRRGTRP
ncbi:MAG: PadR family transcriptional regulator, partial [Nitrososphaerota archaeon]|nr:PadR family transcriptional regulator [Nitrososphaerota archaeon]